MILVPVLEHYSAFTETERRIADFILNDPEKALSKTAKEMAELSDTSPAAIVRFSRKIGFDSFADMKVGLAKYFSSNQFFEKDMIINSTDSYSSCTKKLLAQITDVCTATAEGVNQAELSKVIHMIDSADCVYLIGMGSSSITAMDLQQKLFRVKKRAVFVSDSHISLFSTLTITSRDVVIAFSFSGNTDIVLSAVKSAKRQGAYVVAVTGSPTSPVGMNADACLQTPAIERKLRIGAVSSHYSQQYVSDLIFLCLVSEHYSETEKYMMSAANLLSSIH